MNKIVFGLLTIAVLYACKKKIDSPVTNNPIPIDSTLYKITAHQWEMYDVKTSGFSIWNLPGIIQNCLKDDSYRFYKDSVLVSYENTIKCGTEDSTVSEWLLIEGNKKIKATLLNLTDTADIISLTKDKMQLSLDYNGSPAEIFFRKK